jgi:type II secretory ATPase GspE/PulE/Tfp pilus assembly ATPase PilB-like protein
LTGHLVISTLHAGSCRGVFERLQVLCADHSAVATALELVFNQRLMRRLCGQCNGARCAVCLNTGYQGRVPLIEWIKVNQTLRGAIRRQELDEIAPQQSLEVCARELLRQGVTNDAEYERIFGL